MVEQGAHLGVSPLFTLFTEACLNHLSVRLSVQLLFQVENDNKYLSEDFHRHKTLPSVLPSPSQLTPDPQPKPSLTSTLKPCHNPQTIL